MEKPPSTHILKHTLRISNVYDMIFAKKQTKHNYHIKILKTAPIHFVSLKIPEYMDMQIFFIANCWTQDI